MFFLYSLNTYLKSIALAFYATGLTLLLGLAAKCARSCSILTISSGMDAIYVLRLIQMQEKQPLRGGRLARVSTRLAGQS